MRNTHTHTKPNQMARTARHRERSGVSASSSSFHNESLFSNQQKHFFSGNRNENVFYQQKTTFKTALKSKQPLEQHEMKQIKRLKREIPKKRTLFSSLKTLKAISHGKNTRIANEKRKTAKKKHFQDEEIDENQPNQSEDEQIMQLAEIIMNRNNKKQLKEQNESENTENETENEDGTMQLSEIIEHQSEFEDSEEQEDNEDMEKHEKLIQSIENMENGEKKIPKQQKNLHTNIENAVEDAKGRKLHLQDLINALKPSEKERQAVEKMKKTLNTINKEKTTQLLAAVDELAEERIARTIAYENMSAQVTKFEPLVRKNRDVAVLNLQSTDKEATKVSTANLVSKFTPSTSLEQDFAAILSQFGLNQKQVAENEESQLENRQLTDEEMLVRNAELRKVKALLFYHEQKMRRMNKIKSKTYRRIKKKMKEKAVLTSEELDVLDPEGAQERARKQERSRARERMSLAHKNTGSWAQQQLRGAASHNTDVRKAVQQQLELGQKLRNAVDRIGGEGESDSGTASDDGNEIDGLSSRHQRELDAMENDIEQFKASDVATRHAGVMGMKFMQRGEEREKEAALKLLREIRDENNSNSDNEESNSNKKHAAKDSSLYTLGKRAYGPVGSTSNGDISVSLNKPDSMRTRFLKTRVNEPITVDVPHLTSNRKEVPSSNSNINSEDDSNADEFDLSSEDDVDSDEERQLERFIETVERTPLSDVSSRKETISLQEFAVEKFSDSDEDMSIASHKPANKRNNHLPQHQKRSSRDNNSQQRQEGAQVMSKTSSMDSSFPSLIRKNIDSNHATAKVLDVPFTISQENNNVKRDAGADADADANADADADADANPWAVTDMAHNARKRKRDTNDTIRQTDVLIDINNPLLLHSGSSKALDLSKSNQLQLVQEAFGGEEHEKEFQAAKVAEVEADMPKLEDSTLPGWGSWSGFGVSHVKTKKQRKKEAEQRAQLMKMRDQAYKKRADSKLEHVIISEKVDTKALNRYKVSKLPFPFTSVEQYERSLRQPIGPEWNTATAYQKNTLPAVLTTDNAVINPVSKADVLKLERLHQKQQL